LDSLDQRERYADAMHAERDAWNDVKHTLPGSPAFDEGNWKRWRAALREVATALDETRRAQAGSRYRQERPGGR